MLYPYALKPFADITDYIREFEVVSLSIGYDKGIYVLVQSRTTDVINYKVLTIDEENIYETYISNQKFNYHFVQPIDKDKLLLVGARTRRLSEKEYDLNGKVFDLNGHIRNEFLLGDGVQDVQVTRNGVIWTSYFDEGVFGNNGWEDPPEL